MSSGRAGGWGRPLCLLALSVLVSSASGHSHSHHVVSPRLIHGRHKREISHTKDSKEDGGHVHDLTVAWVDMDDKDVMMDLKLNRDLLPESYKEKYQHKGRSVVNTPTRQEVELCHYTGTLRDRPASWAAVSTCEGGVEGVIFDGQELHHLQKSDSQELMEKYDNPHYLYRHQEVKDNRTCGFHDTPAMAVEEEQEEVSTESFFSDPAFNRMLRYKRDISELKEEQGPAASSIPIKGPWNANKRSRYVELVIVVDNRKYKEYGQDLGKVYSKCKDIANIANALYAPLNIYIALVGVDVWTEYDEITLSTNADTTLTNFLHYRRERLVKQFPNDNAQLLTGLQFDSGVVGKALKGPICTYEFSGGVSMWHSEVIGLVATTMAHEMGHNFGMEHDTENCDCPDDRCIMSPASSTMRPNFWSSCSLEYLALAFEHGMDYCLRNKPRTLFDSPVCGNGFVEPGEECDCGLKEHCDNPCCNPDTCNMFPNATCATGECCDFKTCQPRSPGTVCRFSEHECDLPEYCTGTSEFCPSDVFKVDGVPCKVGQAFCYQGTCRTHSDQCRLLWGPSGKKSDNQCYEQNKKGSRHGNCGYNRVNQSYISCQNMDVRCGMLHCQHLNERLEFGMESVAILSHSFINSGGKIIPCRTALVDLGIDDVDPGLAPEGARCGEDSLCVNQRCMPVASLKIGPLSCKNNCNDHGTCNSLGHCHCEPGWAPPHCETPGAGGSLDSGPASDPNTSSVLSTVLYVIFLFIIPMLLIMAAVTYKLRPDLGLWLKKTKPDSSGFIKVERRSSKARLDSKDISGPVTVDTINNSLTSSPTHALLPRSETTHSDISGQQQGGESGKTPGRFSAGVITGLGGLARKMSGDTEDSQPESLATVVTCDNKIKSRTSNLLKSLNKSISFPSSFPSPKFRTVKSSSDSNKYEVKIEPRQQEDVSPTESKVETVASDQTDKSAASSPNKPSQNSFSTFLNRPATSSSSKACTLPTSLSLGVVSPVEKVDTRVVLEPAGAASSSSPPADFRSNPKLAFPHSSSFSAASLGGSAADDKPAATASVPTKQSVFKPYEPSWRRQPNPNSYLHRNVADRTAGTTTATVQPVTSPFFKKSEASKTSPVTTVTVSPFSQSSNASESTTTTTTTAASKLPSTASSPITAPAVTTSSSSVSSVMSSPASSPVKVKPPTALVRPTISKPILQTATPNAASLIAKAPSTGVSQSSILSKEKDPARDKARRAVFSDKLTLPSPTSPNIPPIIHQPTTREEAMTSQRTITPTWSNQPPPVATTATICHLEAAKTSPDTSGLSKLISNVKRTPSVSVADKEPGKEVEKEKQGKFNSLPRKAKPERSSIRNLEISNPILQKDIEHKASLVPVSRSPESAASPAARGSPVSTKRPAPPPPVKPPHLTEKLKPEPSSSSSEPSEEKQKPSKYNKLPWRGKKEAVSSPDSTVPKVTSIDDIQGYKKPSDSAKTSGSKRRPASIATSKPTRPNAPPPKPPPSRKNSSESSPDDIYVYDDAYSVRAARKESTVQNEPIYDTISEGPELAEIASPEEFTTPVGSPVFKKKSPDAISTGSSAAEEDLMKEILKEMHTKTEGESIYSSLMRKDKKGRKKKPLE